MRRSLLGKEERVEHCGLSRGRRKAICKCSEMGGKYEEQKEGLCL